MFGSRRGCLGRDYKALIAAALVALPLGVGVLASPAAASDAWPESVHAVYDVNFNGLNVGTFEFRSENKGTAYTLTSSAALSLLLGAFKWSGESRASGSVSTALPKPQGFTFDFKSNSKSGSTKMSFADDAVTNVSHVPPPKLRENVVPVLPQHLKGALDPLSAVLVISKGSSANPCTRRIPIYDGKQRFDLLLAPRGQVPLTERQPSGQPGTGYVCRVKYLPIAGHKIDQETKHMSQTDGIEMILRPIPSANVFVPYQITIPTIAGAATLVSRKVNIVTSGRQQIALVH
jgi:Protein of unknown function (DUF3108)